MKVGDLVKHFLTEQIGVILAFGHHNGLPIRVLWTTQGDSLFSPPLRSVGNKEWCAGDQLEVLTTA
jgi:hypothetical protein